MPVDAGGSRGRPLQPGPAAAERGPLPAIAAGRQAGTPHRRSRSQPSSLPRPAGAFENVVQALYKYVVPKPKAECSKPEQLGVSFAAGYIAGIFCAVVSHPADNLVSKMNAAKGVPASECRGGRRGCAGAAGWERGRVCGAAAGWGAHPLARAAQRWPPHHMRAPAGAPALARVSSRLPHPHALCHLCPLPPQAPSSRRWAGSTCSPAASPCASS